MPTVTHTGVAIAQTFRTARAMKISRVGFFLTQLDTSGDVTVLLCETKNAKPDQSRIISKVTVPYADLKTGGLETTANLPPGSFEAGKLYGFILITTGNHRIQTAPVGYTEGTLFYGQDQDWVSPTAGRDLKIKLYADKFTRTRTEVSFGTITLAGGIDSIDYNIPVDEPDGTAFYLEGRIAGVWRDLKEPDVLASRPDTIELRGVFIGTSSLQAAIKLGNGVITARRAGLTLHHLSTARTLAVGKQNFVVDLWLDNYDQTDPGQDLDITLKHGVGYGTSTVGTAGQVSEDTADTKRARFAFAVGSNITSYKIDIAGARDADVPPYLILERVDVAVS
ncbi:MULTISPECIES: hypothetical protein [unclassified Shinella]|uniref:hypothetical protein n=1 Tax=unclassified Shinella TaxID=2643062 RepID=UPI00234EEE68|nr:MULTISPECIES: hypothetical protein [unclassified Shinella]MCO5153384.1 hypothetical protein [Shinella sp.]MDC7260563.1 hypothetical protein [Shinella sp. HY16]MDC7267458.1 hypothetical protein [Shinella sp. YZ44]